MVSKEKPYVLYVAEIIYLEISKIKKNNLNFSNIDAIDNFIGSKIYIKISSGKFHDEWFEKLEKKNFKWNNKIIKNSKRHDDQAAHSVFRSILYKKSLSIRNFSKGVWSDMENVWKLWALVQGNKAK